LKIEKRIVFANAVLTTTFFGFLFAFVYLLLTHAYDEGIEPSVDYAYGGITLLGLFLYGWSITWEAEKTKKVNFALVTVALGISIYLGEIAVALSTSLPTNRGIALQEAKRAGMPVDNRSKIEVLKDLRGKGIDAYTNAPPGFWRNHKEGLKTTSEYQRIYPLAGISKVTTVFCNEIGKWEIEISDEYGFWNPSGLFQQGEMDLVLVGDSFTQGSCVRQGHDTAGRLRDRGFKALSLGSSGNGPLIELATLTEYAVALQPKVVLWMFYEGNDLVDFQFEKENLLLMKYLDNGYSQGLMKRQIEIDEVLKKIVREREKEFQNKTVTIFSKLRFSYKLYNLRSRFFSTRTNEPVPSSEFAAVFAKAKKLTESWGGQLYFVYLPARSRYARGKESDENFFQRSRVLSTVHKQEIPIVDFHKWLVQNKDPLSFFPFRAGEHYTVEGYRMLADLIQKRLLRDGVFSLEGA
jgi:hypothetical protein